MAMKKSGTIVNVGSVVGNISTTWAGSYCASKSGVHAMTNSLRFELKPFGINVVLVLLVQLDQIWEKLIRRN